MSRTLYETNALSGYASSTIASEITIQKISGRGVRPIEGVKGIYLITEEAEGVPPFTFPIEVEEEYYIDARSFTSVGRDGVLKIRDLINYNFQVEVALLERAWAHNENKDEFFYLSSSNLTQFATWLSSNIAHQYRMDYSQEMNVRAAVSLYYVGQHYNNIEQAMTKTQFERYIMKNVIVNQEALDFVTSGQDIDFPRTVNEFCDFMGKTDIHLQMKDMNRMVLSNLMSKTFTFGLVNPNIVMRVAFEHPPVWMALRSAILNNTFLRKSILGEQLYKDRTHKQFLTTYNRFIERCKG